MSKEWNKIVAKAWVDEDFKQRLLDDPTTVLREEGVDVPEGMTIKCVENTESQTYMVLPFPAATASAEKGEERIAALMMM